METHDIKKLRLTVPTSCDETIDPLAIVIEGK